MGTQKKQKEGSILPLEEPGEIGTPWYRNGSERLIRYLSSERGIIMMIGLLTIAALSFILSFDYLFVDHMIENGVSKQDIKAPYSIDVMDEVETKHKIDLARQSVPPIYKPAQPINASIREDFDKLLTDIQSISNKRELTSAQKKRQFFEALPEGMTKDLSANTVFSEIVEKPLPQERWFRLRQEAENTLDHILQMHISPADFYNHRDEVIMKGLSPTGGSHPPAGLLQPKDPEIIRFLIASVLQPNQLEDEEAMAVARQAAGGMVKPVIKVFRQGDYIITKGEPISDVKLMALEKIGKSTTGVNWVACLGILMVTIIFVATVWQFLASFDDQQYYTPAYLSMISLLTVVTALLFKLFIQSIPDFAATFPISPYVFPLATYALILTIFTHPRIGLGCTALFILLMSLALRTDIYTLTVLLCSSLMGNYILSRKINFRDRNQLVIAGLYVSLSNVVFITAVHLISLKDHSFAGPGSHFWMSMLIDLGWGTMSGFLSTTLAIGVLPFLESMFHLVTPYTLMELANHDQPLLKRMQFEAPGTFHHSLMVASMSEAAAEAISANALLTRVGCLYHDIGKMKRPLFFIENQAYFGVENPHDKLTPRLSKMVVTAHPRDSLEMARQYGLPKILTHFMTEHHGTLVAGYFYNQACQQEGADKVIKSQFRYPGPKPLRKETAIVMLADACESAVRALKNPTVSQIEERIDRIIQQRIEDGQFDNCPITFKDISIIKETFVRILRGIQHSRIEYQQNVIRELGRKSEAASGSSIKAAASGSVSAAAITPPKEFSGGNY